MRLLGRLNFFSRMALTLSLLLLFLGAISLWQTRQTIASLFFVNANDKMQKRGCGQNLGL